MCCEGLDSVMHAPKCAYMYVCARVSYIGGFSILYKSK